MFVLSEFHIIRIIRNTKGIAENIVCFHINQNFVLSEFVLSGFYFFIFYLLLLLLFFNKT